MKYLQYATCDVNNGEGLRNVLWLSGCSWGCEGCFNEISWDSKSGEDVDEAMVQRLLKDLEPSHIQGLTLSGGDPLHKRNYQGIIKLCQRIKYEFPNKDIWLYTGYTLYQIQNDILRAPILDTIDILIDGKYDKEDPTKLPFRGSHNQRRYKLEKGSATLID